MTVLQRYSRRAAMIALPLFTFSSLARAEVVLEVDLSVTDQITISAAPGLSAATVSGSDDVGFYLENFFGAPYGTPIDTLVAGDLTSFLNTSDLSPILWSYSVDPGLNVYSYTGDPTSDFTAGTQAFSGSATWDITPADYAACLAGPGSGDVWAIADDVGGLTTASIIGQFTLAGASVGTQYCAGDGLGTACPCGNNNNGAMGGCDWGDPAFPEGGVLDATGSDSMAANNSFLEATGVADNFGVFFGANNQVNGGNGNPLNDGLRCAGGGLVRLIPPTMASGNMLTLPAPIQTLDTGAAAGVTRRYQYWFRTPGGPCGQTANLTNGYEIVWVP